MSNTTTITGNLTREPEIRYTKEGQATAQLGVAVNRRWQDRAPRNGRRRRRSSTSCAGVTWPRTWPSPSPRGCAWSSPAAWSSAAGRPTTVSTAPRSRSWPTRSARACASPPRRAADRAPRGGARVKRRRARIVLRPASRAGSPASAGGPTRGTQHLTVRKATPGNGPGSAGVVARLHALSESAPWRSDMSPSKSHATRTSANPQNVISPHLQPRPSYPHPPP
jgi:hypothetical protein